jgi:hypothetical protein
VASTLFEANNNNMNALEAGLLLITFAAAIGVIVWGSIMSGRWMKRDRILQLGERVCLSADDFWEQFYAASGLPRGRAEEVLKLISEAAEIPQGMLRPQDRFRVELRPLQKKWGSLDDTGFSMIVLTGALEKKYGVRIDLGRINTVDDYIRVACGSDAIPLG